MQAGCGTPFRSPTTCLLRNWHERTTEPSDMNDPHIVALLYEITHDETVDYTDAQSVEHEEELFCIQIEDKRVRLEMKEHYATEVDARRVVEPYIRSWELDASLCGQPGQFSLRFVRPEIRDRNPTPGALTAIATLGIAVGVTSPVIVAPALKSYPKPPSGIVLAPGDPDVLTMLNRFEGYLNNREPLPSMAYFCYTMLTKYLSEGPTDTVNKYGIGMNVLTKVRTLASTKGGRAAARKMEGIGEELDPSEVIFLKEAVKVMIRRVAELAHDPHKQRSKVTLADLPKLPR